MKTTTQKLHNPRERAPHNINRTQEAYASLPAFRKQLANKIALKQFEKPVNQRITPELILIKVLTTHYIGEKRNPC